MNTDKFYVINNNIVTNVIVCTEEFAAKNNLIRFPVMTEFGLVDNDWTYINGEFLPPPRNILKEWEVVRINRDVLLAQSDLYVMPDRWQTYTPEQQQAISNYRQELRDITSKFIDPKEVVFPKLLEFL